MGKTARRWPIRTRRRSRSSNLRRAPLQKTLMTRAKVNHLTRNYFTENGFLELETPFMVKYTPGGARNFLVPRGLASVTSEAMKSGLPPANESR